MKSILLYNLYPKNHWLKLTQYLLRDVPHQDIVVNVSLDWQDRLWNKQFINRAVRAIPKVREVFYTKNSRELAEVTGFENMRRQIDFRPYEIATYLHSKGVTKPTNECIKDWVELMRYFQIARFDLCLEAFRCGYALYGVNLSEQFEGNERLYAYRVSDFHYSGNFVSVNLKMLRDKFLNTTCDLDYYGVEGFWGKLCDFKLAYNAHLSSATIGNHYLERYPASFYKHDTLIKK
jgi:hypothetical protein